MKTRPKWVLLAFILAVIIAVEAWKGEKGQLLWTLVFCAVVVLFFYSFAKRNRR